MLHDRLFRVNKFLKISLLLHKVSDLLTLDHAEHVSASVVNRLRFWSEFRMTSGQKVQDLKI